MRRQIFVGGGRHVVLPGERKKVSTYPIEAIVVVSYVVVAPETPSTLLLHHENISRGREPAVFVLAAENHLRKLFDRQVISPSQALELDVENIGSEPVELRFGVVGTTEWSDEPPFLSSERRKKLLDQLKKETSFES